MVPRAAPDLAGNRAAARRSGTCLLIEARDTFEISAREVLLRASDRLLGGGRARRPKLGELA